MPPPMDVRDCKASCATLLAPMPGDGIEPGWIGATLPTQAHHTDTLFTPPVRLLTKAQTRTHVNKVYQR